MWNFVSLNFLASEGIGFVPAEDEDLTVTEDEPPLSPPWREEEKPQQIQKSVLFRPCMCVSTRSGFAGVHKFRIVTQYRSPSNP